MRLFLFDFDGTLVDTAGGLRDFANHMRAHFDLPELSKDEVLSCVGWGQRHLLTGMLPGRSSEDVDRGKEIFDAHYRVHMLDDITLYPGVRGTLVDLREQGISTAIVSNKNQEFIDDILKHLGIEGLFVSVIGLAGERKRKPDPDMLQLAMREAGAGAADTVMIGDSEMDIQSGKNAGVRTAACTWGFFDIERLKAAAPDIFIDDFPAVKGLGSLLSV